MNTKCLNPCGLELAGPLELLRNERFDELGNFGLLASWQLGDLVEDFLQPAFGAWLALGALHRLDVEQLVSADAEGLRELGEHLAAWRLGGALPESNVGLLHADGLGELMLAEARSFAECDEMLADLRAWSFGGSSHDRG